MENDTLDRNLKSAHGLSIYIEHNNHKILFDLGPNNNFYNNARILGIDLSEVDIVVISHGHFDHGNGLKKFMKINSKAKIYLSDKAFGKQTKKIGPLYIPIGIKKPLNMDRIHVVTKNLEIAKDIKIYAKIKNVDLVIGDNSLYTKIDNKYVIDQFDHEIYLVVSNDKNNVLFSGCSHKGIENIVDELQKEEEKIITHVIGGFHMSHYNPLENSQSKYIEDLGKKLYNKKTKKFYSCHCTGEKAFTALKPQMKEKLQRIKTGSIIEL